MIDKNFTECILLNYESLVMEKMEKVMENHGIFCNLKSMNPDCAKHDHDHKESVFVGRVAITMGEGMSPSGSIDHNSFTEIQTNY